MMPDLWYRRGAVERRRARPGQPCAPAWSFLRQHHRSRARISCRTRMATQRMHMKGMYVKELWRFPVKSMAGERLERAAIGPLGIAGDRIVHVRGADGRVVTSRTHHRLLGLKGTTGSDGQPLVNGEPWNSARARALVEEAAGADAHLALYEGPRRFDVLPLLVATDGAIEAFGRDGRRLRYNVLVG